MTNDDMILRVAMEEVRGAQPRYYTFDHRRLYCFLQSAALSRLADITQHGPAVTWFNRHVLGSMMRQKMWSASSIIWISWHPKKKRVMPKKKTKRMT